MCLKNTKTLGGLRKADANGVQTESLVDACCATSSGHILQSPSANVLPTLPFHVLRALFSSTPLTTDDGVLLRRMALEIGAVHLILACLSALSHHAPRNANANANLSEVRKLVVRPLRCVDLQAHVFSVCLDSHRRPATAVCPARSSSCTGLKEQVLGPDPRLLAGTWSRP